MCQCGEIGGPFISEDPDCPIHGEASQGREESIDNILEQVYRNEISVPDAREMIIQDFLN